MSLSVQMLGLKSIILASLLYMHLPPSYGLHPESNCCEQQGHGVTIMDGLLGYGSKCMKPKAGPASTIIHPAGHQIHHSQPTRPTTSSMPSVHTTPRKTLSPSECNQAQGFHMVGTPEAVTYEIPGIHQMSPIPISGVKKLYANNENDGIEEDEPGMMEVLGK